MVTLWGSIVVDSAVGDELECPVPFGLRRNIREYLDIVTLVDGGRQRVRLLQTKVYKKPPSCLNCSCS